MPVNIETPTPIPTGLAGKQVTAVIQGWWHGTGLSDVIPQTEAGWRGDVIVGISDEISRAERALAGHLVMIQSMGEWKRFPADHSHPQLVSEPDD